MNALLKNFDLIADIPGAIPKLRQLILDLAVRGKLVPQDTNDEPASELLKRIGTGKTLLFNQGSTKKNIKSGSINDRSLQFNIPNNWKWTWLADVTNRIQYGYTASAEKEKNDDGVKLLRITDIQDNNVEWDSVPTCEINDPETDKYKLYKNDILVARTGGTVGKTFLVGDIPCTSVFASYLIRIQGASEINKRYLKFYLESPLYWIQLIEGARGAAQPNINGQTLGNMTLPLPPLAEQKRIVAKVDELMAICDQLEAQQAERAERHAVLNRAALARFRDEPTPENLRLLFHPDFPLSPSDLRKTILDLAVRGKLVGQDAGDESVEQTLSIINAKRTQERAKDFGLIDSKVIPFDTPQSWTWIKLGNLALKSDSGWSPQCESTPRSGNEWGVLKVSAVSWGVFDPEENKALPSNLEPRVDCEVRAGDFLLSRANTEDLVARSVIVEVMAPNLMMSDKIVRFQFPDEVDKYFLNFVNSVEASRKYYAKNASGTSSSMKNIGREVMCNLPIPLPPLAEQKRIVARVNELMALVDELMGQMIAERAQSEELLKAILIGAHHE